ncbi:MAG: hypothetical protein H6721_07705 [Sandaracinus sp.]|nr:hypothetical protein [Sandaracinus sp.]MCB9617815.1 hypothetical protein [Sandaracinus sp.]MCB9632005.1 hypothetical protein [Sandaracinus sp.]
MSDVCRTLDRPAARHVSTGSRPARSATYERGSASLVAFVVAAILASTPGAFGCGEPAAPTDLRLLTPKTTAETLLDVYGVADVSEEEVRRRMQIGRSFHLNDPDTRAVCFADLDESAPEAEGLVGYVFGSLASGKSDLEVTITGDVAHVFGKDEMGRRSRPVVMRRHTEGWKIVLRESVPVAIQRRLVNGTPESSDAESPGSPEAPKPPTP